MTHQTQSVERASQNRWQRLLLLVGFCAMAGALVAAIRAPATGFELSIYRATPAAFWVGTALAVLASLVVTLWPRVARPVREGGVLLAGTAVWSILALPLLRSYYFYGGGDALSHLGFVESFASGAASPFDLIHPGVHLTSILVSRAGGLPFERALVFVALLFPAVFIVFVVLCVRHLTGDDRGAVVGLFAALLLLPLNNVAIHLPAHPSSQAVMFTPLVLYLLFRYLRQPTDPDTRRFTALGVALALVSAAIVLVHPEQALNVLMVFGSVVLTQVVVQRFRPESRIAEHHSLYFQTGFLAVVFTLWSYGDERVMSRITGLYQSLFVSSGSAGGAPGAEVAARSGSLAALGGSLEELFVKLFLPALVFSVLAGELLLLSVLGKLDEELPERNAYTKYLAVSFVPLTAAVGVIFLANFGDHYFRLLGFLMTIVTILGAVALYHGLSAPISHWQHQWFRVVVVVLFVFLLPLVALSFHPSPWIYQGSGQITEQQFQGYETAFDHRQAEMAFTGVRGGTERYVDAVYGPHSETRAEFPVRDPVPTAVFGTNLTDYYEESVYLPVTAADEERETVLYRGFRYPGDGFHSLRWTPGIDRVQSGDGFTLYLVR
ncbi:hypothetical protein N0B31_19740 [Salinirubellus salinus]|uniref:Uncharacterized protein n=1 Tax=Salinirubellus salinus TaxID=1364945 RepID=A0A9E7R2H8_9EURY|nr:hypothetical protein [Salinirubellus salinus]UWM54337.1 hypothetical protein N0B31_19740 [Salinirubellus salinus]